MEELLIKAFGTVVTFLFALFGWLFKGTATKAGDAMALSEELKGRVRKLEATEKEVHKMAVSFARVEEKVENIEGSLRRIETYILEERKQK